MGVVQVIESEKNKNFGSIVIAALASKLAAEFDSDLFFWVQQKNSVVKNILGKQNNKSFGAHSWIQFCAEESIYPSSHL